MDNPRFTGGLTRVDAVAAEDDLIVHSRGMARRATQGAVQAALGVPDLLALIQALEARVAALEAAS